MSKDQGVRAWQDTITIPTYERGAEDKNPPLLMDRRNPIHPGSSIIYPYPMQEALFNRKADRRWKAFLLENEYLRLAVLPELGGRLLYAFDKVASEEAIYHNHVLKFARIGIRGAWVSGGIEWNFPNGHTVTSSSPIDCAIRRNPDGSASILFGDIERVSRMRWSVALSLYPGRAYFQTEMRLSNRTFFPGRFWFWANSAAPASEGMEFLSSASKVMTLKDVMSFPVHEGVDISWDKNHVEAQDMFCLNPRLEFVGWYNHDLERGLVNVADRSEARGTKFFTWGNSDDGHIWEGMLTDEDGPYAEMQSGRLPTMGIWEILAPCAEEGWRELWYPVRKIGAPSFANREAAISLRPLSAGRPEGRQGRSGGSASTARLHLGVQVTSAHKAARLALAVNGKTVWEQQADLDPAAPLVTGITLQETKFPGKEAVFTICTSGGELLARSVLLRDQGELEYKGYLKIRADRESPRAEEQWRNGAGFEKLGDYEQAREAYRRALQDDPDFSAAEVALGVLDLRRGKTTDAAGRFQKVLQREPGDEAARFYLGACRLLEERRDEAINELKYLLRSGQFRCASAYLLGGLYLGQGDLCRAVEQLEKVAGRVEGASALLAGALRRQGRLEEARARLEEILAGDPLDFLALSEAFFLEQGGKRSEAAARERLEQTLRDEVQSYMEVAGEYARFGLYQEAYGILGLYNQGASLERKAYPMVDYCLGYYAEKLGRKDAATHFQDAAKRAADYVFPHRLESEAVLRRAIVLNPREAKAKYYLGNLLCARERPEEALELWKQAAGGLKGFSVVRRNIGRAYWKALEQPDAAIAAYREALEADPQDYKLYFELNRIYLSCGLEKERSGLIESIPEAFLASDVIAEMVAAFHVDRQEWDPALKILGSSTFYPWEIYKGVRLLYVDANIGKGISLLRRGRPKDALACFEAVLAYPRNIGVGEPFHKANAEAHYRIGLALKASGDAAAAEQAWQKAAQEPRPRADDLCFYQARALQQLGKEKEAGTVLRRLLDQARSNLSARSGDAAENLYLSGLAHKGLGQTVQALQDFQIALALNRAHRRCHWQVGGFSGD